MSHLTVERPLCGKCGQPCVRTWAYTTWINGKLTAIRVGLCCLPPAFA